MKNILLTIWILFCSVNTLFAGNPISFLNRPSDCNNPIIGKGNIYDSLNLAQFGLSKKIFDLALRGWEHLRSAGKILNENVLSIIDYSQSSNKKRLYIIDLANIRLLFNTYVAHGRRSGKEIPTRFSNRIRSKESSVGFYLTADPYLGSNGYSLKLLGVEHGFNSNAARREIVMHGADYVSEEYISTNGYLGRSWGCPAVPQEESRDIIDSIKNGSCLFVYYPQSIYLKNSRMIRK
ncbi:MAG: murein L,D-transpeptidase catalytic domain family protein [Chitinophagales bacterium]